jgi:trehalose 6-phosphate synthase
VSPITPDHDDIAGVAESPECQAEAARLDEALNGRALILRVDRIELSKNLLRGFRAFDDFLLTHPEWRGRVVFAALVYPSREGLPEYLAYRQEVETMARHLNDKWSTPGWSPVLLDTSDNFARSVAALRRYDVLLVNPVRDGLNLVAKEGPLVNDRNGVLLLSREAGAWEEMAGAALEINPFDVAGTAEMMATALAMSPTERATHAAALQKIATARRPRAWLDDQISAAVAAG